MVYFSPARSVIVYSPCETMKGQLSVVPAMKSDVISSTESVGAPNERSASRSSGQTDLMMACQRRNIEQIRTLLHNEVTVFQFVGIILVLLSLFEKCSSRGAWRTKILWGAAICRDFQNAAFTIHW